MIPEAIPAVAPTAESNPDPATAQASIASSPETVPPVHHEEKPATIKPKDIETSITPEAVTAQTTGWNNQSLVLVIIGIGVTALLIAFMIKARKNKDSNILPACIIKQNPQSILSPYRKKYSIFIRFLEARILFNFSLTFF